MQNAECGVRSERPEVRDQRSERSRGAVNGEYRMPKCRTEGILSLLAVDFDIHDFLFDIRYSEAVWDLTCERHMPVI